jgi:hypothetical protein
VRKENWLVFGVICVSVAITLIVYEYSRHSDIVSYWCGAAALFEQGSIPKTLANEFAELASSTQREVMYLGLTFLAFGLLSGFGIGVYAERAKQIEDKREATSPPPGYVKR